MKISCLMEIISKNVMYKLISVINRIEGEKNDNKRSQEKYVSFTRINNAQNIFSLTDRQVLNLDQIKLFGTVLILFYYSIDGMKNFSEDFDMNVMNSSFSQMDINTMNFNNFGNNFNFYSFNNNGNMNMNDNRLNFNNINSNNLNNNNFININLFKIEIIIISIIIFNLILILKSSK